MRTLISILGRGPYRSDGKRSDYRLATYRFIDKRTGAEWFSSPNKHFAFSAYEHSLQLQRPFEKIVLLGTSGSMWDTLAESFGGLGKNALSETLCNLSELVDCEKVTQSALNEYAKELSSVFQGSIQLKLIPAGLDEIDQAEILNYISEVVERNDEVYLDVTHGYRHLPMLGLSAAALVTSVRGAQIDDIAYGALDMTRDGITPVISLKWILELLRVLNGVNELTNGQHLRPIIACFPSGRLRNQLEDAAYKLDVMRIDEAARSARECIKLLDSDLPSMPIEIRLVADAIRNRLDQFSKQQRSIKGLMRLAELALEEDEFLRVAIFLTEALELAVDQKIPGDDVEDSKLKTVRNWLAHAGELIVKSKDKSVRECIASRSNLRSFFAEQIQRLKLDLRSAN